MSLAHRIATVALAALVALQFAWHAPGRSGWLGAAVYALPLLWVALLVAARRRGAFFWAGVLALPYLCHGVAEAFASPPDRVPALIESCLATVLAVAVSWDGLRARGARRRATATAAATAADANAVHDAEVDAVRTAGADPSERDGSSARAEVGHAGHGPTV